MNVILCMYDVKKGKVILLTNLHRNTVFTCCSTCCLIGYATCAIWFIRVCSPLPQVSIVQPSNSGSLAGTVEHSSSVVVVPLTEFQDHVIAPSNPAINIEMPILITYCFNTPNLHILYIYTGITTYKDLLNTEYQVIYL